MKNSSFLSIVGYFSSIIGGALIGNGLGSFENVVIAVLQMTIGVLCLAFGLVIQRRVKSIYRKFSTRKLRKVEANQRSVLILLLSQIQGPPVPDHIRISGDLQGDLKALAKFKREQHERLANDKNAVRLPFWSWEQPLRAIAHNLKDNGPLDRLILIGSQMSIVQMNIFVDQVLRMFPKFQGDDGIRVQALVKNGHQLVDFVHPAQQLEHSSGFDFEDFDGMTHALDVLLRNLIEVEKYTGKQIQVDFTGGQKPASAVAAVVTLFSNVSNQYVATNPKCEMDAVWQYPVFGYDFQEEFQPTD